MRNLLASPFVLVVGATNEPILTLPPSGNVATVVPDQAPPLPDVRLEAPGAPSYLSPVVAYAPPKTIKGLPTSADEAILVSAQVADAMRALRMRYGAGVYSPMQLIFRDGKPLGSPGLIEHVDLRD